MSGNRQIRKNSTGKKSTGSVKITFWGVRGSIPAPGAHTVVYGGNTPCVSVEVADRYILLDAGSGIRIFGNHLVSQGKASNNKIDLFITHTHWDHIQGLPFFATAFIKGNLIRVFGPKLFGQTLENVISNQMEHSYFPIRLKSLGAEITFNELIIGKFDDIIENIEIETLLNNHPVLDMSYKFTFGNGASLAYVTDFEYYSQDFFESVKKTMKPNIIQIGEKIYEDLREEVKSFVAGVDLLIMDAVYTTEEYSTKIGAAKIGWGHSCFDDIYRLANAANVKNLCFFHHEPNRADARLAEIEQYYVGLNKRSGNLKSVFAAKEGMSLLL